MSLVACGNPVDFEFARLLVVFASVSVFAGTANQLQGQTFRELTTVREIRALPPGLARGAQAVRLRGVVTVLSGWKSSFFFQDATSGISVDRTNDSPQLEPGESVEVRGVTGPGMFAPVVIANSVTVLGTGKMPPARLFDLDQLAGGRQDSQWLAIQGIVRSAAVKPSWGRSVLFLEVDIGGGNLVTVRVHDFSQGGWAGLPGATVSVRGVCGTVFNDKRQFVGLRLFVANLSDVKVVRPAPPDTFDLPLQPLDSLLQFGDKEGAIKRIRVRGVVTYSRPGQGLYIQDGLQGVFIPSGQESSVALGSRLEVVGYPAAGRYSPELDDAVFRSVGSGPPLAGVAQSASALIVDKEGFPEAPFDSVLVRVKGRLVEKIPGTEEDRLLFKDGAYVFTATLSRSANKGNELVTGSLLSITGVCAANTDEAHEARSFEILLRSSADLLVLERAPWWTPSHAGWVVALLIVVVLGMSGWLAIVRRKALDTDHRKLELFFDSVAAILIVLDAKGGIVRWNSMAAECFHLSYAEVQGKDLSQCGITWLGEPMALDFWVREEFLNQRRELMFEQGGEKRSLSFTVRRVQNLENGGLVGFLINAFDTTKHRALEVQLRHAQKLESIGQLAAGIAHEINTPLQFVGDNTQFLQEAFRDLASLVKQFDTLLAAGKDGAITPEVLETVTTTAAAVGSEYLLLEIPKALEQTLEGVQGVSKLVAAMKEFTVPGTKGKVMVDLNRAIESTITVAGHEWKCVADLETDFDPSLPFVPCLADEFKQAILNLIVNGAHAIADTVGDGGHGKGRITIRTRNLGSHAEVQVQDTGTGIPLGIQDRIFDPFFTTKEVGKGTGQGLAITHASIVKKHGGSIRFTTEEGKGTSFFIQLPIESKAPDAVSRQ